MEKTTGEKGVLGNLKTREQVMYEIRNNQEVYTKFLDLNKEFQERFVQFCMGVRGVMMTYDSFFQKIFDVEVHPERISEFISRIVGKKLKVKRALPKEHRRISEKGSLLIMDILAETEERELVNVEIQKIGYLFPGQRAACYAADMLMRQYEREKSIRGEDFNYRDMKKVYTIVIMEQSSKEFKMFPKDYVHHGTWKFNTGLNIELLSEFYFISLDIFINLEDNKKKETIINELEAWLYFIASDKPEHIEKVLASVPRFEEMYREIIYFRYHPEEAICMFSEALRVLDENTVKYMIEEMKQELNEKNHTLDQTWKELEEVTGELEEKDRELTKKSNELREKSKELTEKDKELTEKDKELTEKDKELADKRKELNEVKQELERLREELAQK